MDVYVQGKIDRVFMITAFTNLLPVHNRFLFSCLAVVFGLGFVKIVAFAVLLWMRTGYNYRELGHFE